MPEVTYEKNSVDCSSMGTIVGTVVSMDINTVIRSANQFLEVQVSPFNQKLKAFPFLTFFNFSQKELTFDY